MNGGYIVLPYMYVSDLECCWCDHVALTGEECVDLGEFQAIPLNFVMQKEVRGETQAQRWGRFEHNIINIVSNCVQPSTQGTYANGWDRWVKFNNWFGTHPYLEVVPIGWKDHIMLSLKILL